MTALPWRRRIEVSGRRRSLPELELEWADDGSYVLRPNDGEAVLAVISGQVELSGPRDLDTLGPGEVALGCGA